MNPARSALLLRLIAGMVIGTLAVTGCGGTTEDATDSPSSTSAAPGTSAGDATTPSESAGVDPGVDPSPSDSEQPAETPVIIEIQISAGQVRTEIDRVPVAVGDAVRMTVASDVADQVHVHGIEELLPVEPGERAVLEFVVPEGTAPGLYEVETHDSALLLLQLEVT